MATNELESLLIEYESKRRNAEVDLENKKQKLYKKLPRLEEIDSRVNKISINKAKNILINPLNKNLNIELDKELNQLKKEKEQILKKEKIDDSFFKPKYECEKCGDTGYISYPNKMTQMCSCLKQRLIIYIINLI